MTDAHEGHTLLWPFKPQAINVIWEITLTFGFVPTHNRGDHLDGSRLTDANVGRISTLTSTVELFTTSHQR
jgi:hypothetical protein